MDTGVSDVLCCRLDSVAERGREGGVVDIWVFVSSRSAEQSGKSGRGSGHGEGELATLGVGQFRLINFVRRFDEKVREEGEGTARDPSQKISMDG